MEGYSEEDPVDCISKVEVVQALNEMKTGKASGLSEVSLEMIAANGGEVSEVMTKYVRES